jgi:nucleoside-diphosphate kinase
MSIERTLSLIKPSAVADNHIGAIIAKFEKSGLKVVAVKMLLLTREKAELFYDVHKEKPFFEELVSSMISGQIVAQVLEGDNAIQKNRDIMGATNPAEAEPGTIRAEFATSMTANAVHGSDAPETAEKEIRIFFSADEIHSS